MISLEIQIGNDMEKTFKEGFAGNLEGLCESEELEELQEKDLEETEKQAGKVPALEKKTGRAKKVFICSPYHPEGETEEEIEESLKANIALAQFAASCVVKRGDIPYAPHLYFPGILDEDDPQERESGIRLGLKWLEECDEVWVAGPRISTGMRREIKAAHEFGIPLRRILMGDNSRDRLIEAILLMTDDDGNIL